jgi:putative lipoic acid-binding regulatory protein
LHADSNPDYHTRMNDSSQILYPARVMMKVIMSAKETEEENQRRINDSIEPLGYQPSSFSSRLSRKGRWMSISFFAEVDSNSDLQHLYETLSQVPGAQVIL